MTNKIYFFCFLSLLLCSITFGQNDEIIWYNPTVNTVKVIEGQAWPNEMEEPYDRLPLRAESQVRKPLWSLSKQTAGLMIRFRSNSPEIKIRYGTAPDNDFALNHMPATGVSGIDLYAITSDGKELWCAGKRSFSDTINYRYDNLAPNDSYHKMGREYRLYLPLYNQVNWLEVGIQKGAIFEYLPVRLERPIVVYGTSIAQGACASRPGMAWTSILGRKMDRPLINLGFSGNGRLEAPLIDLISEIDAKIYILDCLPNLSLHAWERAGIKSREDLKIRIINSVKNLRLKKPLTPILLTEHAGYTEEFISPTRKEAYSVVNEIQKEAFYSLKNDGIRQIFYLSKEEIALSIDAMVDGVHPTDLGMMQYALTYEKKLREILKEPVGLHSTTKPITQYREPGNYDWEARHREILTLNQKNPPKHVFIANSIIHFWGGMPTSKIARETDTWQQHLTPMGMRNLAYGWDRIENVLWRVYHGELDGFEAEKILVMIGTNNLHLNSDEEILEGLSLLADAIINRQEKNEIIFLGLLPRRDYEERIVNLNFEIAKLSAHKGLRYHDIGHVFLNSTSKIEETLFSDGLHPNSNGYMKLRPQIISLLE